MYSLLVVHPLSPLGASGMYRVHCEVFAVENIATVFTHKVNANDDYIRAAA